MITQWRAIFPDGHEEQCDKEPPIVWESRATIDQRLLRMDPTEYKPPPPIRYTIERYDWAKRIVWYRLMSDNELE